MTWSYGSSPWMHLLNGQKLDGRVSKLDFGQARIFLFAGYPRIKKNILPLVVTIKIYPFYHWIAYMVYMVC